MSAPRKFDEETRARAVRLYTDWLRDHGESKLAARRHVGQLLDINPATLRNWIEADERVFRGDGARPSTQVKLLYIHAYRHRFGVEPICAVLSEHGMKIAPQTYYRWPACPVRLAELEEAHLVNEIVNLYRRNKCVYGVRKMWHAARRSGLPVGRDQVGRLMRIAGIQGVRRGAHHT